MIDLFHRSRSGFQSVTPWVGGIALGAALMYVLDPERGRRRRALARDKAVHVAHKAGGVIGSRSRNLSNRARGIAAEAGSALQRASEGAESQAPRPDMRRDRGSA